jgi:hypothetical protein
MADNEEREGSWWTTVPGILTALATTITAVGGLIAVLAQTGFLDRSSLGGAASAATSDAAGPTGDKQPAAARTSSEAPAKTIAHSPAEVIKDLQAQRFTGIAITQTDDTVIPVRPGTFAVRGSIAGFPLASGQTIEFDRVRRVDVVGPDRLRFLLVNGQQLEADVEGQLYYIAGQNDLGRFDGHIKQVTRIDFLRP